MYPIVEMFNSIQGEGFNIGKPSFFIRFAGCDVCCCWCDEKVAWDTNNYEHFSIQQIIEELKANFSHTVVITGGEPFMHDLKPLIKELKKFKVFIQVETSGCYPIKVKVDWITLSPKKHFPPLRENLAKSNELKVIISSEDDLQWAEYNASQVKHHSFFYLQPEWSKSKIILPKLIEYIKKNPKWRLSVQVHKFLNIP